MTAFHLFVFLFVYFLFCFVDKYTVLRGLKRARERNAICHFYHLTFPGIWLLGNRKEPKQSLYSDCFVCCLFLLISQLSWTTSPSSHLPDASICPSHCPSVGPWPAGLNRHELTGSLWGQKSLVMSLGVTSRSHSGPHPITCRLHAVPRLWTLACATRLLFRLEPFSANTKPPSPSACTKLQAPHR